MKKIITISLKIIVYGLLVPLIVLLLADLAVKMSCKYYWGEELLSDFTGFKISMWILQLSILLTIIYYIFCILFFLIKKQAIRMWILAGFLILPIMNYYFNSVYDYRITVSFAMFHLTFYIVFFTVRHCLSLILKTIRHKN